MNKGKNLFQPPTHGADLSAVVQALENLQSSHEDLRRSHTKVLERLDLIDKHNEARDDRIKDLFSAFPAGDVEGHRRYHEMQMEILAEKRKLRIAIQEKTISALIWIAIVAVGTAIWHEIVGAINAFRAPGN